MTFKTKLAKKLALRIAYQNFWLAQASSDAWYNAGLKPVRNANGQDVGSHVAGEIDLTLKYPLTSRMVLVGGYSHLFAGAYISDTGTSVNLNFAFLMTKIKF